MKTHKSKFCLKVTLFQQHQTRQRHYIQTNWLQWEARNRKWCHRPGWVPPWEELVLWSSDLTNVLFAFCVFEASRYHQCDQCAVRMTYLHIDHDRSDSRTSAQPITWLVVSWWAAVRDDTEGSLLAAKPAALKLKFSGLNSGWLNSVSDTELLTRITWLDDTASCGSD